LVHSADDLGKYNFISQACTLTTMVAVTRNMKIAAIVVLVNYQAALGLSRLAMT
jgi:hypothetical protein